MTLFQPKFHISLLVLIQQKFSQVYNLHSDSYVSFLPGKISASSPMNLSSEHLVPQFGISIGGKYSEPSRR